MSLITTFKIQIEEIPPLLSNYQFKSNEKIVVIFRKSMENPFLDFTI
jgi:hypothetical protein